MLTTETFYSVLIELEVKETIQNHHKTWKNINCNRPRITFIYDL